MSYANASHMIARRIFETSSAAVAAGNFVSQPLALLRLPKQRYGGRECWRIGPLSTFPASPMQRFRTGVQPENLISTIW
jgi:hypothetical protein